MKNIILIGMKSCGKTTVGILLAKHLHRRFIELDKVIEEKHNINTGERLSCREIFTKHGEKFFRTLEIESLKTLTDQETIVLSCGGGAPLSNDNRKILQSLGMIVFLDVDENELLTRIIKGGIPPFFPKNQDPKISLQQILAVRISVYMQCAAVHLTIHKESPAEIVIRIIERLDL
jgi:shikimate kinase